MENKKNIYIKEINLNELKINQKGIIKEITTTGTIKRRFLDLGLVKGTPIIPVLVSPTKEPRAFEVRGSVIAIRKEDAQKILVCLT